MIILLYCVNFEFTVNMKIFTSSKNIITGITLHDSLCIVKNWKSLSMNKNIQERVIFIINNGKQVHVDFIPSPIYLCKVIIMIYAKYLGMQIIFKYSILTSTASCYGHSLNGRSPRCIKRIFADRIDISLQKR